MCKWVLTLKKANTVLWEGSERDVWKDIQAFTWYWIPGLKIKQEEDLHMTVITSSIKHLKVMESCKSGVATQTICDWTISKWYVTIDQFKTSRNENIINVMNLLWITAMLQPGCWLWCRCQLIIASLMAVLRKKLSYCRFQDKSSSLPFLQHGGQDWKWYDRDIVSIMLGAQLLLMSHCYPRSNRCSEELPNNHRLCEQRW